MTITATVRKAAKAVAKAVGISTADDFDRQQIERFHELQKLLETKAETIGKLKETSQALVAAEAASRAGACDIGGIRIEVAIANLRQEHARLSAAAAAIQSGESEIIGICPSADLQRKRRQWAEMNKQLSASLANVESRITNERAAVKRLQEAVASLQETEHSHPQVAGELVAAQRRLRDAEVYLRELVEEHAALIRDRQQHATDREELHRAMREFQV